eukprot:10313997-Alexandrium_andersonii.AAC.1
MPWETPGGTRQSCRKEAGEGVSDARHRGHRDSKQRPGVRAACLAPKVANSWQRAGCMSGLHHPANITPRGHPMRFAGA